ncbi:uncharacterized protein LOC113563043 [Ooceraea biroi]|uniref:uncharacterized protein LOC113563043 n=1 Tax=Ooceraea biroi TaxID=2015173 RepID=UPI000F08D682|nr:uncharacterized protein LOC113563043 [Ooceraea biroi]
MEKVVYNVLMFSEDKDDLTNIYYGKVLLPYVRHYHLENVWQEFINRPPKHQLLEEMITFIIQWFHPEKNVSCSHIDIDLDNIAQQVMKRLKVENPKHPIFSASREQFSIWKYNNIYENQWNNSDGRQIINILFNILLYKPTFEAVVHSLKSDLFRQYLLMEDIMNSVSLTIIFQSVARRLGIYCDLVSFLISDPDYDILFMKGGKDEPYYWLLKWKPKCLPSQPNLRVQIFANVCSAEYVSREATDWVQNPPSKHTLLISLSKSYMMAMEDTDYNYYHGRNCNNFGRMFEEGRWWIRFLHLVKEDLSTSLSVYMREQEDGFKLVDGLV